MDPSELTFDTYWTLIKPAPTFYSRYDAAKRVWDAHPDKHESIIGWLKKHGAYPNRNPYFFILDWQAKKVKQEILSFNEYYMRYGTTEERDGWKMANPTGQKVIYVKAG